MQWHLVVYLQTRAGLTESVVFVCVFLQINMLARMHKQFLTKAHALFCDRLNASVQIT